MRRVSTSLNVRSHEEDHPPPPFFAPPHVPSLYTSHNTHYLQIPSRRNEQPSYPVALQFSAYV